MTDTEQQQKKTTVESIVYDANLPSCVVFKTRTAIQHGSLHSAHTQEAEPIYSLLASPTNEFPRRKKNQAVRLWERIKQVRLRVQRKRKNQVFFASKLCFASQTRVCISSFVSRFKFLVEHLIHVHGRCPRC
ncbi:uncharacterized protein V6R79_003114 [Siganus canaliculatus]